MFNVSVLLEARYGHGFENIADPSGPVKIHPSAHKLHAEGGTALGLLVCLAP